jgi:hypothetical protein
MNINNNKYQCMGQVGWRGVQDCAVSTQHPYHRSGYSALLCLLSSALLYFFLFFFLFITFCLSLLIFHTPILVYRLLPSVYSHSSPFLSFPFSLFFNHSCLNFIPYVFLLSFLFFQSYSLLNFSTSI